MPAAVFRISNREPGISAPATAPWRGRALARHAGNPLRNRDSSASPADPGHSHGGCQFRRFAGGARSTAARRKSCWSAPAETFRRTCHFPRTASDFNPPACATHCDSAAMGPSSWRTRGSGCGGPCPAERRRCVLNRPRKSGKRSGKSPGGNKTRRSAPRSDARRLSAA